MVKDSLSFLNFKSILNCCPSRLSTPFLWMPPRPYLSTASIRNTGGIRRAMSTRVQTLSLRDMLLSFYLRFIFLPEIGLTRITGAEFKKAGLPQGVEVAKEEWDCWMGKGVKFVGEFPNMVLPCDILVEEDGCTGFFLGSWLLFILSYIRDVYKKVSMDWDYRI